MNYTSSIENTSSNGNFSYTPYMIKPNGNNNYVSYIDLLKFGRIDNFGYLNEYRSFDSWQGFIVSVHEHLLDLNNRLGGTTPVPTTISVTSVSVSPTSATINVNGTQQLSATVSPSDATNKSVTWSSSNTSVATVSSSGLVTGVSAGTATITVKTNDGNKTATSTITVQQSQPQPTSNYYWYIGVENPENMFGIDISNVQTDNTVAGWHEIGSSLSGFVLNTDANPVHVSDTRVEYYIIIPNDLHIYNGININIEKSAFDEISCNMSGYKAFKYNSEKNGGGFYGVRDVYGVILKE